MAIPLKPCPFCDSSLLQINQHLMTCSISCQHCNSSGPHRSELGKAINDWNLAPRGSTAAQKQTPALLSVLGC